METFIDTKRQNREQEVSAPGGDAGGVKSCVESGETFDNRYKNPDGNREKSTEGQVALEKSRNIKISAAGFRHAFGMPSFWRRMQTVAKCRPRRAAIFVSDAVPSSASSSGVHGRRWAKRTEIPNASRASS